MKICGSLAQVSLCSDVFPAAGNIFFYIIISKETTGTSRVAISSKERQQDKQL